MYTIEEFDRAKTKILKYILYQRRSEYEVRNKFSKTIDENMLEDIIEYLKKAKYINDKEFIQRKIENFMTLKNMSIKEIEYKLIAKGLNKNDIEEYIYNNENTLYQYEIKSAQNIIYKKQSTLELEEIKKHLFKKGYKAENIAKAIEQ